MSSIYGMSDFSVIVDTVADRVTVTANGTVTDLGPINGESIARVEEMMHETVGAPVFTPDGRTILGSPKFISRGEWEAILNYKPDDGALDGE